MYIYKNNMDNFKTQKFLKINWLKNNSDEGGAMKMVLDSKPDNNIIVHCQTQKLGRMWADMSETELLNLLNKDNGIYEVITQFPHKVYFDIDKHKEISTMEEDGLYYEKIINKINELFPNSNMAISGSLTETKTSYHITLNNYVINNIDDRDKLKSVVKYLNINFDDAFDWKVYTKNRNMKAINQSKGDGRIQKIILNDNIKNHLITCFIDTNALNFAEWNKEDNYKLDEIKIIKKVKLSDNLTAELKNIKLAFKVDKATKTFNLGELPILNKLVAPETFNYNSCTPIEILELLPINNTFAHDYTHQVARFCYYNELTFDDFIAWYSKKSNSKENYNKWVNHWNNLNIFPPVLKITALTLLCKYYPNIRREKKQQNFINLFDLSNENIIRVDELTQDVFYNENEDREENIIIEPVSHHKLEFSNKQKQFITLDENLKADNLKEEIAILKNLSGEPKNKFILLNTGMGSGKTYQTIEYLKKQNEFIWMTPIEALAQNTHFRLEEAGIKCKYYKDFKNKDDKTFNMSKFDKLIICINSIPYTKTKTYKTVIIDEIETFLIKLFNNSTFKDNKQDCWVRLIEIIRAADKVIFLDAFITKITINFINNLKCGNYQIYEKLNETSDRNVFFMANYDNWLYEIIEQIKNNKKPFIFYPYLRAYKKFPSMEELKLKIEQETNKLGVCYNSQIDDITLKGLKNVNESWSKYSFVITNTKITVGINYELNDFDTVYLSIAGFNSTRDIIQVSYRCRNIKSNNIKVCYIEKTNTNNCYENDDNMVDNCDIYKNLVKDILIEKNAPLKSSFLYLCNKAHYKISITKDKLNKELSAYIEKLFSDTNLGYSYETIPIITNSEVQEIEKLLFTQSATLDDKLKMQKYYFNMNFKNGADIEMLKDAWDGRYIFF